MPKSAEPQPQIPTSQSKTSLGSASSSNITPINTTSRVMNRTSAGTTSTGGPGTPLTPFSPGPAPGTGVGVLRSPDPQLDPAGYLRSLAAVRERCKIVTAKACKNELLHFNVDMQKFPDVVSFVANIIKASSTARWLASFSSTLALCSVSVSCQTSRTVS